MQGLFNLRHTLEDPFEEIHPGLSRWLSNVYSASGDLINLKVHLEVI